MTHPADVPAAPQWAGDAISYAQALDSWLAQLHERCADQEWVRQYREAMGDPPPVETILPQYPPLGDKEAWGRWWKAYNRTFKKAGASADGIDDPPPPHRLSRCGRRKVWRKRVASVVRDVLARELPEALATLRELEGGAAR